MENVYSTGYDHDVKAVVLYSPRDTTYLYEDEACTIPIDDDKLMNLFIKGMLRICNEDGYYYVPTSAFRNPVGVTFVYVESGTMRIAYEAPKNTTEA